MSINLISAAALLSRLLSLVDVAWQAMKHWFRLAITSRLHMWLKSIAENKVRGALIVCIVALVIRLIYCFTSFQNYLSNDAIVYHTLAVNVALGNGYSTNGQPPYEPHFLREPGYPLFLAAVYYVYTFFGEPHYVESNQIDIARYPEITWARVAQAIVGAATCVIFLLLLRLWLRPTAAFVIAVLFAAYLPLAAFSAMILRETLQTFLVMVMSYAFARFLLGPRWQWLGKVRLGRHGRLRRGMSVVGLGGSWQGQSRQGMAELARSGVPRALRRVGSWCGAAR